MRQSTKLIAFGAAVLAAVILVACCRPVCAFADELELFEGLEELDQVKGQIEEKLTELDQISVDIRQAKARIDELDSQMGETLGEITDIQADYAKFQGDVARMTVEMYKDNEDFNVLFILQGCDSFEEAMWRLDMRERVLNRFDALFEETRQAHAMLEARYRDISLKKDEQSKLVADLKEKSKKADEVIGELREREKVLSAAQEAALAQAAAAAHEVAQTFETGSAGDDKLEWKTGLASAYGGSSDDSTPNPGVTATGTVCDDYSIGVAVPMSWHPGNYYGRYVEISYAGQSIIAPVVDCGDMDSGRRALDLQPGVFKAFGCATCDDWGVREIQYRFLQ